MTMLANTKSLPVFCETRLGIGLWQIEVPKSTGKHLGEGGTQMSACVH